MDQNTNQPETPQSGPTEPQGQSPIQPTPPTPQPAAPQNPPAPAPETPAPPPPSQDPAAQPSPPVNQPAQAKKGSPLPMILGAIVFVIIVGVLGYVYMMSKQTTIQQTPEPIHQAAVIQPTPTTAAPSDAQTTMTPDEMKNMKDDTINNANDSSDLQKGAK